MFKMLGAAVAAVALTCAGSAGAAVLYQESGTASPYGGGYYIDIMGYSNPTFTGPLHVKFDYVGDGITDMSHALMVQYFGLWWTPGYGYTDHGTMEFATNPLVAGSDNLWSVKPGSTGFISWAPTETGFEVTIQPQDYTCDDWGDAYCTYFNVRGLMFIPHGSGPVDYSITISSREPSAVPEPNAWALMIAGFGLVGSAMRSANRRRFPHPVEHRLTP